MKQKIQKSLMILSASTILNLSYASVREIPPQPAAYPVLEKSISKLGGIEKLKSIVGLKYKSEGVSYADDEAFEPGTAEFVSKFTKVFSYNKIEKKAHIDTALNLNFENFAGEILKYDEILHSDAGSRSNGSSMFDEEGVGDVPLHPGYLGAMIRQSMLLNPYSFLLKAMDKPELMSITGTELINGNLYDLLVIKEATSDITLYINSETGVIKKLETFESGNLRRDVPIRVEYSDWTMTEGLLFPHSVDLYFDDMLMRKATRSELMLNPVFDKNLFKLPKIELSGFTKEAIDLGAKNRQSNITYQQLGIDPGLIFSNRPLEEHQVADGITKLSAGLYSSLIVEQSEYLILLEAPVNEEHSKKILDWVKTNFCDKKIEYVVPTHHHQDHAAGVRAIMAQENVELVVLENIMDFWKNNILSNSSSIVPDLLESNPLTSPPAVTGVPIDGKLIIGDINPVTIHHTKTEHAKDMVISSITKGDMRIVFEGDLYNPGMMTLVKDGPADFIKKLQVLEYIDKDSCAALGGMKLIIAGVHGTKVTESIEETVKYLQENKIAIPCKNIE